LFTNTLFQGKIMMKKINIIKVLIVSIFLLPSFIQSNAQDKLIQILDEEVQREMKWLKTQEIPAYYLCYRVDEIFTNTITTSFGSLIDTSNSSMRILTISLRVGSHQLDNYHFGHTKFSMTELPSADEPIAVKQVLWNATKNAYQQAINNLSNIKANMTVSVR